MRIADTSLLYALFSEKDVHHKDAVKQFENSESILIPSEIWSETISLVHYRKGHEIAVRSGKALMELPHVDILATRMDMVMNAWKIYKNSKGKLSVPDCFVLCCCKDRKATPLSFDKDILDHYENTLK